MKLSIFFIFSLFITHANEIQINIQKYLKKSSVLSKLETDDQLKLSQLFADLGHKYRKKNKWVLSVIYYRKSLSLNPSNPQLILFSGMNYAKIKRYDKAEEFFLKYKQVATESSWLQICNQYLFDTLNAKGDLLSKTSLWDLAILSFKKSLEFSNSAENTVNTLSKIHYAYFQKGSFHFSQKHYIEASKSLIQALTPETNKSLVRKIERMASHLFINSAKHYEKEGQVKEAQKYYKSIVNYFNNEKSIAYSQKRIEVLENFEIDNGMNSKWISE